MYRSLILTLLLTPLFCQPAWAEKAKAPLKITSEAQQISYALGLDYMKGLQKDELKLDNQAFLQALTDVQTGRPSQLDETQTRRALDKFIVLRIQNRQQQASATLETGKAFLAENQTRPDIQQLDNGLQYRVLTSGNGQHHPNLEDGVSVRYRLTDIENHEILSSPTDGTPKKLVLKQLIPGWQQALQAMQTGDKWQVYLPPQLAYGENGTPDGRIKPNQTLVYELELVEIVPAEAALAEMDKPTILKNGQD